ncbi:hypothetical protein JCM11641_007700 [Rhodosporidiobolus odoratus]
MRTLGYQLVLLSAACLAAASSNAPEPLPDAISTNSSSPTQLSDNATGSVDTPQEGDSEDESGDVLGTASPASYTDATTALPPTTSRPTASTSLPQVETAYNTSTASQESPASATAAASFNATTSATTETPTFLPSSTEEPLSASTTSSPLASLSSSASSSDLVEELPLTEVPPVPELLSFKEWRERYVVLPDPSLARRAKKAAQRARQEIVGAPASGAGTAAYDGDGADLGSLFAQAEEEGPVVEGAERLVGTASPLPARTEYLSPANSEYATSPQAPSTETSSPIQPLPNVGTGEPSDPLLHLKDRSNYAAFECAAMVHRSSRQSKGASSILVEKKDRYMLTPCSAKPKFVDVELCDEIQIDTLVLANFEFFSSTFKHFKASCSVDYPGKAEDWHDLGTFRARNMRGIQVFRPNRNPHFCRYLRLDFLSHFGSEFYCPVSLLRAYGFTQLDAYRDSERKAKAIAEALAAAELIEEEQEEQERRLEDMLKVDVGNLERLEPEVEAKNETAVDEVLTSDRSSASHLSSTQNKTTSPSPSTDTSDSVATRPEPSSTPLSFSEISTVSSSLTAPASSTTSSATVTSTQSFLSAPISPVSEAPATTVPSSSTSSSADHPHSANSPAAADLSSPSGSRSATRVTYTPSSLPSPPTQDSAASNSPSSSSVSSSASSAFSTSSPSPRTTAAVEPSVVIPRHTHRNESHSPPPHHARAPVIPPPIHQQPQPGESIYGTIMKRLTSLEHNQTLSMHFIEAQSSMLREAFGRIERRLSEVESSKSRQEQSIRQALLSLEHQGVDLERERVELATQISLLTQEVRFEKRLAVAQLIALLAVVVFVGFTRSIPTSPFLHLVSGQGHPQSRTSKQEKPQGEPVSEKEDKEEPVGADASRRSHRHALSVSLTHRQHNPMKRYPSLTKPGPRRHYGVGTASSSTTKPISATRSSRPWTPPTRHSSAPPEDPFPASAAQEAKEAARRRIFPPGSARRSPLSPAPLSPRAYEFPARSSVRFEKKAGLAIDTSPEGDLRGRRTSSIPLALPLTNGESADSSTADEADIEPSDAPLAFNTRFADFARDDDDERLTTVTPRTTFDGAAYGDADGDDHEEHGYHTYSSSDDMPFPTSPPVPPSARSPSPRTGSSASRASKGLRPPRPQVMPRPATSIGIPFPSTVEKRNEKIQDRDEERAGEDDALFDVCGVEGLEPSSAPPTPPPEQKETLEGRPEKGKGRAA